MATQYCAKCNKTMVDTNFYTYKDGTKCDLCKACLTMHVNNFEPDTFLWLLEKFDVPYLPQEQNVLRDRAYQKDPYKMNGMSVFGRYLSKMKLKQQIDPNTKKPYTQADTEFLQKKHQEEAEKLGANAEQEKARVEEMKIAYENGEISEAQYQTYAEIHAPEPVVASPQSSAGDANSPYPVNSPFEEVPLADIGADLTDEDKVYLAMKWGQLYRPAEWVALESLYKEFTDTFDIQGAARLDTLKLICKTSLKMNQAIDCGDVDSYQKYSRVYDAMMKSAKFTEAQNKEGKGDFVDCIGSMVAYCERKENGGAIPKYEIDVPYDVVDKIIDDLKLYNKTLIYEDKALAEEIERYLKNKENAEAMRRDREEAKLKGLDQVELDDEDFEEFQNAIQEDLEQDASLGEDFNEEE